MNELKVLNEQEVLGKQFRVYGTVEEPLFLAKDVAEWIEHSKPSVMIESVDEDEKVKVNNVYFENRTGGNGTWFLTENGLYEVLMQSRKPIAKQFKKDQKAVKEAALGIIEVAGEKSIDSFHKSKDLTSTNGAFRMGHDEYSFDYDREAEVKMGVGPDAPTKKVFARANVRVKSTTGSTTIKAMKDRLAAAGLKKYGN